VVLAFCSALPGRHLARPEAALCVALAKALACMTADRAVCEAVQIHGGMGMTDELDIGLFMKRVRTLQNCWAMPTSTRRAWPHKAATER
jgi:alkylation response protein AidB-like acyl-CoA dehydrogenase